MRPFTLHCPLTLLADGWHHDVRITIAEDGRIANVERGVAPTPGDRRLTNRVLLPAPSNLHSHGFQRALAGRTQRRGLSEEHFSEDSFWSWRQLMYRFMETLTPDMVSAITAQAQVEMCEAGYAAVAEFHYLHHAPSGRVYTNPAEISERICEAANTTGIGLTLLPVLYTSANAHGAPPQGGQRRFACNAEQYQHLWERAASVLSEGATDWQTGIAPHSLRAVPSAVLAEVLMAHPEGPIHLHIAEQAAEVAALKHALGAPPVAWLLNNHAVDKRWCLVHATHINETECTGLAASGAVAGLCPITEADLGDGVFPAEQFLAAGGNFGVGTDSNVRITLAGELGQLEYSQRLVCHRRNVLSKAGFSTGGLLFDAALKGGARALNRDSGSIEAGRLADLLTLDTTTLALYGLTEDELLDGWIFSTSNTVVGEVWSAGRQTVAGGRHVARDVVAKRYRAAMDALVGAV